MIEGGSERKIHIRLREDTHRQLRIRCAELDVSIQDYVAGVIEDSLEVTSKKSKARQKTRSRP
jgi:predicted HicB family RNase H-like nuclease